jgi:uncharacterized protein (DUF58 family)
VGAGSDRGRSREGDFAGLRAFRPGDDRRDIHWRSSARRGLPLVREHEDDTAREATVVLDDRAETCTNPETYERAISKAAGLCVELARRGYSVALRTRDGLVPPGNGPAHTARLLRYLALLPAVPDRVERSQALPGGAHRGGARGPSQGPRRDRT